MATSAVIVSTDARTTNRWVLLAAAVVVVGLSLGTILSLGVFLAPIQGATGWSRTDISAVALLSWVTLGIGSFLWGVLCDRSGPRAVVGAGGLLLGLGLVLASQATALWQFMLAYGGLVGLAVGAFYAPLTSTVSKAFRANRGLALGLLSAGGGLGTVALAPLGRWLITEYGWRTAMLLLGDLAWLTMVPLALVIRDAPAEPAAPASAGAREPDLGLLQIGRTPQFWLIALTHFTCCVAHSGPIFHMVANATDHGVAQMAAATVFGVSSLASIGGRIASGFFADRLGSEPTPGAPPRPPAPAHPRLGSPRRARGA